MTERLDVYRRTLNFCLTIMFYYSNKVLYISHCLLDCIICFRTGYKAFKLELRLAKNFPQIWQHSNTSCIPHALSLSLFNYLSLALCLSLLL